MVSETSKMDLQIPVSCCGRECNAAMIGGFLQERCGYSTQKNHSGKDVDDTWQQTRQF